jgi:hypothetical protein
MSTGLGREDIRALLDDPSEELASRGARAELFLVGGAALAVAYDATRATRDLDAVFIPSDVVRQAAAAVAQREGLAEDWLNDAVKGFLPGPDPDAQRFYSLIGGQVRGACPGRGSPSPCPRSRRTACEPRPARFGPTCPRLTMVSAGYVTLSPS